MLQFSCGVEVLKVIGFQKLCADFGGGGYYCLCRVSDRESCRVSVYLAVGVHGAQTELFLPAHQQAQGCPFKVVGCLEDLCGS